MKRGILIVAAFIFVTVALTYFWEEGGRLNYGRFLKTVAPTIYDALGVGDARVGALRQRYINWIPFVGLVAVTPGLALRRRLLGLLGGLGLLFVGHLALNLTERVHKAAHLPFVPSLVSDALPFLLWIIVAWPVIADWFAETISALPEPTPAPPEQDDATDSVNEHLRPIDPS